MLETLDYTTRIAAHRPFYISIYIDMIVRESEDFVAGYFNGSFKNVAKHNIILLWFVKIYERNLKKSR